MKLWHDDDRFWEAFAPTMFTPKAWERAPEEVDGILERLDLPPGAGILDMSCGPGRHSLELARRGFAVTGVDRTALYLEQARSRAEEEGLALELVHSDMRAFRRPEAFDAALSMFTSFGYFDDPADDRRAVENFLASLRPGGRLMIEMMGKEILARIFRERDWDEAEWGLMLQERKVTRNWSWTENRWILIRDGQVTEFSVCHRLYSAAELVHLVEEVGFVEVDAFGDLAGAPYDQAAKRLILTARKAEG